MTTRAEAITALTDVSRQREAIDQFERDAIDTARAGGASWAEIAAALGLASRQAAEQRRARLGGSPPRRQQRIDTLRQALYNLAKILETPRTPKQELAGKTIAIALEAPPGQLIDLAKLVAQDLNREQNPTITAAAHRVTALTR